MNQSKVSSVEARESCAGTFRPLTWRGFAWAAALPAFGVFLFYSFIAHVRLAMGSWPVFGEKLATPLLSFHCHCVMRFALVLFASIYVAWALMVGSACFRRWRHIAIYSGAYLLFIALAFVFTCILAPHPFLNWFFD
jgi:hypothetical protein